MRNVKSSWALAGLLLLVLSTWAGCSFDDKTGDATCNKEGDRDGSRICRDGYWVYVGDTSGSDVVVDVTGDSGPSVDGSGDGRTCEPGETRRCYSGPSGTAGTGVCSEGTQTCEDGQWGACEGETTPARSESCGDSKDIDCDGATDNGCPCDYNGKSKGVCKGLTVDSSGTCPRPADYEQPTDGEAGCDSKDNDCDGATDEGCLCDYKGKSDGVCASAVRDAKGSCQKPSGFEQPTDDEQGCDGKDNDCDGKVDEGTCECPIGNMQSCYSGPSGTAGTGICEKGKRTCQMDGSWGKCMGETTPKMSESCNNKDDDCDGKTDENLTKTCGKSTGQCQMGTKTCSGGMYGTCSGGQGPKTEKCDAKDHDCDGKTRDATRSCGMGSGACASCKGVCHRASETCSQSGWSCQAPADYDSTDKESDAGNCDGKDNDCDGATDEGCCTYDPSEPNDTDTDTSHNSGVCTNQPRTSSGSCKKPSAYQSPEDAKCSDGKDNDCDGLTDESTREGGKSCTKGCQCHSGHCQQNKCAHAIFVTSKKFEGNLGGLSGADQKCTNLAKKAGLNGNWKAVLSDPSTNAKSHISVSGKVYNMKGTKIADGNADLWDGNIDSPVRYTEKGGQISKDRGKGDWVWTGTGRKGTLRNPAFGSPKHCSKWSTNNIATDAFLGDATEKNGRWLAQDFVNGSDSCTWKHYLYCIDGQ